MNWAERIKELVTMQDVLESYASGKPDRMGKYLCPFHSDKHPSLSINNKTGKFKCFSCHEGGDVIDFVEKFFKCTQKKAVEILNDDFGLGLFETKKDNRHKIDRIMQQRDIEEQLEIELERRLKMQRNVIHLSLTVARDIIYNNYPPIGNELYKYLKTDKPQRYSWAVLQEQYALWLLDCLDCTPFDEKAQTYHFDIFALGKNPCNYAENSGNYNLKWKLSKRQILVLEMLEKGELGYIWLYNTITT